MANSGEYLAAWGVYLAGAVVLMVTVWRLSSRFWGWLQDVVRVAAAVLLFTPARLDGIAGHWAPAVVVVPFELLGVAGGGIGYRLGIQVALIALLAIAAAWTLRFAWGRFMIKRRNADADARASAKAAHR
jgi:hypothetical protein